MQGSLMRQPYRPKEHSEWAMGYGLCWGLSARECAHKASLRGLRQLPVDTCAAWWLKLLQRLPQTPL